MRMEIPWSDSPITCTEDVLTQDQLQAWLEQSRLYALIDGLNLPDLPGQVSQRHPHAAVTLYSYSKIKCHIRSDEQKDHQ